jgi:hypothetical protein
MSDITVINDSEQSSLVTNGLAKNGELYLKAAGSTDAGAIVVYDSGSWRTFANEASPSFSNQYSLDFDGTDDYVSTGLTTLVSTWSVSVWFKPAFTGAGQHFLTGRATQKRLGMYYGGTTYIDYYLRQSSSPFNILNVRSTDLSVLTQWNHLVWTKDNATTTVTMYLNGSQIDQDAGASSAASDFYPEVIGAINTSGTFGFKGKIDEFGWWDSTALSSSDVTAIYNSGVPDDLSSYSPTGWWRMGDDDSGAGTTITDQGSGGNDGTLVNGPTFSSDVPS